MKYDVNFSCGHTATVELLGKSADRERKIKWYEDCGECPDCYKKRMEEEKAAGCKEVVMKYSEYKTNYSDCKTKADSYDSAQKTIIVYVPLEELNEEIIATVDVPQDENNKLEGVQASFSVSGDKAFITFRNASGRICRIELTFKAEKPASEIVKGHTKEEYEKAAKSAIKNINIGKYGYWNKISPFK